MKREFLRFICLQVFLVFNNKVLGVISNDSKATIAASQGENENGGYPGDSLEIADTSESPVLAPRIIGGGSANVGEWPWQAMILRFRDNVAKYYFECVGSLIGKQWVLTAAGCLKYENYPSHYLVVLGAHHKNLYLGNHAFVPVGAILRHPDYNDASHENDIGLAKLGFEVTYAKHIAPVRLAADGENAPSTGQCVVTGWGDTKGTGDDSILQEAHVSIVPSAQCAQWWRVLPKRILCAGLDDGSGAVCTDDGGAPLVCNVTHGPSNQFTQFGIASFTSANCTKKQMPAVYTYVAKYSAWIKSTEENSPDVSKCFDTSTIRTCGEIIMSNNTIFRSPVANNSTWIYPNNVDCAWTIRAPIGYVVRFKFLCFFSTEATTPGSTCDNVDYLEITNTSGRTIKYCGSHVIEKLDAYETDGNKVTLTFHSNSALTAQGFVVRADFVKKYPDMCFNSTAIHSCGSVIATNDTIFRSPIISDGTWRYPTRQDCSWTVRAPANTKVKLEFLCFFDVRRRFLTIGSCGDAYLLVQPKIGRGTKYCGMHKDLEPFETSSNEVALKFRSDSSTSLGFVIKVTFSSAGLPAFNMALILVVLFAAILTAG